MGVFSFTLPATPPHKTNKITVRDILGLDALKLLKERNFLVFFLCSMLILHGICYDFFFVTGQIYTNEKAGETYRSSAQGMITLATYGVGMMIGFWVAGLIADYYTTTNGHLWKNIWLSYIIRCFNFICTYF